MTEMRRGEGRTHRTVVLEEALDVVGNLLATLGSSVAGEPVIEADQDVSRCSGRPGEPPGLEENALSTLGDNTLPNLVQRGPPAGVSDRVSHPSLKESDSGLSAVRDEGRGVKDLRVVLECHKEV